MPLPDFVLCCNNICNCMIKWYENIAKELDIPMIMIDIPFNPDYEVSDAECMDSNIKMKVMKNASVNSKGKWIRTLTKI